MWAATYDEKYNGATHRVWLKVEAIWQTYDVQ